MVTQTKNKKQELMFREVLEELKSIREQLKKFLILIPEESLKEYKNSSQIKKAYLKTVKSYSPK